MRERTIQLSFFIAIALGLLVFTFFIFKPYLGVIFLSAVLAVFLHPLHNKLTSKFGGREHLAALAVVAVAVFCIVIPAILLSASLLKEAVGLYNSLVFGGGGEKLISGLNQIFNSLLSLLPQGDFYEQVSLESYARDLLDWIIGHFDSVFTAIFGGLFKFILMLLSLFYFLVLGGKIKQNAMLWSPLPDQYDEEVINGLKSSFDAVLRGLLLVAFGQGLFMGLGFLIFGLPNPVLWGFVAGLASLVPIIGTAIITIPASAYLFLSGSVGLGFGILLWGALCVGMVDNVLAFFFLKNKIKVHPLIVLFSILGGIELFGALGFLIGPVAVSAFLALMKIYPFIIQKQDIA